MEQFRQEWSLDILKQRWAEAEQYRQAAALRLPLRRRMAQVLRQIADTLEGGRADLSRASVPSRRSSV